MNKLKQALYSFYSNRYGVDTLYYYLTGLFLVIYLLSRVFNNPLLQLLSTLIMFYALYRSLSKNKYARSKENRKFKQFLQPIKRNISYYTMRIKNATTYRYRRCPNCHKTLRLPIKRGKKEVKCPTCSSSFKTFIL